MESYVACVHPRPDERFGKPSNFRLADALCIDVFVVVNFLSLRHFQLVPLSRRRR